ncbi:MAG: peptidylprolyl isomerase [Minicystis sp.]
MQKWSALVFAAVTAAFVAVVLVGRTPKGGPAPAPTATSSAAAPQDAGAPDAAARPADAGPSGEPAPTGTGDETAAPPDGQFPTTDAGATLIDGTAPPGLAGDAPKTVVFGVILVQYKGAQGAPASARSREAALDLAKQLAVEAKKDFKATVQKGDKGSMDNAGRIPRGMLEPAPEYVLFSLPKDGVSDPVDTPRGYWIVHRIE